MAEKLVMRTIGVLDDVVVKEVILSFLVDLIILYCKGDFKVPINYVRPFLIATKV